MSELEVDEPAPGVRRLTINRPGVRNAISLSVQRELDRALTRIAADDAVRSVIIAGAGPVAFSAGYDITELARWTPSEAADAAAEREELVWRFWSFPKPVVAAVDGTAHGAGTILAVCADIRVGDPRTRFAVTAARYGGANLTWLLDSVVGAGHARDLLMTSRAVDGAEAYRIGLLSRFVEEGGVSSAAVDTAAGLAELPPEGIREIKSLLQHGPGLDLRTRYDREIAAARTHSHPDQIAGLVAGLAGLADRDARLRRTAAEQ
ncbi:enoyl-CoA hydratase/isomerase family protein [Gordonia terrae]